jgi:hypothetical protein
MIPETANSGAVELYRAIDFPTTWIFDMKLIEMRALDATVFKYDGAWWMFVSPMTVPDHAPIALLFTAPNVRGPWRHASASPISCDVRSARGGGAVVLYEGQLIRPAQDCSVNYGRALIFNCVTSLTEDYYAEKAITRLEGCWLPRQMGVHCYSRASGVEAIDGLFNERSSDIR